MTLNNALIIIIYIYKMYQIYKTRPIWKGYEMIKSYYPMTAEKDGIIQELSIHFPNADPEIQSSDGLFIDILWHHIILSITDDNHFSISTKNQFIYFENINVVIEYIKHVNELYINQWIVSTEGTCSGAPRLKNTRLRVMDIVHITNNESIDRKEIIEEYMITNEQIDACLVYYEKYKNDLI